MLQLSGGSATLAKYSAPRSQHWLKRPRLFDRLDRLVEMPVVWIAAPAGCGKTVLAASYLAERRRPVLWYRIDDRDTDPGAFFHRLREAACQCDIEGAKSLPALTGEYAGGEEAFARNYIERLCHKVPTGFVMVFDDFQQLPEQAPLQALTNPIFDSIPPTCTAFVLSRHTPPWTLARLRANRQIGLLSEAELRLTEAETEALIAAWPETVSSTVSVETLHKRIQGWAAGVVLTLEHQGEALTMEPQPLDEDMIFDYFAAEVVATLESGEREFLQTTALTTQFDASLARELSGNPRAEEILRRLLRRNFFVYQEGESYRYHPLFRDFLLRTLQLEWPREQLGQQRLQSALLLLERGEPDMALPLLRDAGEWARFIGILLEQAPTMMRQGRHRELERWLQTIPADLARNEPWLDYWLATSRLSGDYFTSHELYCQAYNRFEELGESPGIVRAWIGVVDAIVLSLSEQSRLDPWLQRLDALRMQHAAAVEEEVWGQLASRVMIAFTMRCPRHPDRDYWLTTAEQAIARMTDINERALCGFYLVSHLHWGGDLERAAAVIDRNSQLASDELPPLAATTNLLAQSWRNWITGRFEACRESFAQGVTLATNSGVHIWTVVLQVQGAINALMQGEVSEADGYLKQIEPMVVEMRDLDQAYYFINRAWAELSRGDKTQALSYQRRALKVAERSGTINTWAEACYVMAQVWHELGETSRAREHLQQARKLGRQYGSWTMAFQCHLAEAQFAWDGGDRGAALAALETALAQAREHVVVAFLGWRPQVIARLCSLALEEDLYPDLVLGIISRFRLPPPVEEANERWPWPVKIYTLGRFALVVGGAAIDLSGGKHRRPCTLLKLLIAAEPHGVAESRLAEILWPDADGDVAIRNLRTNLHRLRKLLDHDGAIRVVQGRVSLDPQYCYCDVHAIGRLLHAAQNATGSELSRLADRLLSATTAEFLPGEEGDLIENYRRLIDRRLRSSLPLIADQTGQNGNPALAEALSAKLREFQSGTEFP